MATGMICPYMFNPESVCCTIPVRSNIDGTVQYSFFFFFQISKKIYRKIVIHKIK